MRTWLEYRGQYSVSGDKVYVDRVEVEAPLYSFPFYELMEPPQETWLVYGPAIRAFLYEDWGQGGHYWIYPFIKPSEIWIDSGIDAPDRPPVWMRFVLSRFLMKEYNLNYLEADVVARAYATDYRVEEIRTGKVQLHSFYPKKANLTITYKSPSPEKIARDQEAKNWELEEVRGTLTSLQAKSDKLKEPAWQDVIEKLTKVAEDLSRAENL